MATRTREPLTSEQQSLNYFSHPTGYTPNLSRTKDGLIIVGCIEPRTLAAVEPGRETVPDVPKNIIQTPGGAFGVATAAAIQMGITESRFVTTQEGYDDEKQRRILAVVDGHKGCAFMANLIEIMEVAASKDEYTLESFRRWDRLHRLDTTRKQFRQLRDGAKRMGEYLATNGNMSELIEDHERMVDQGDDNHPTMRGVVGANVAQVYVVNHHPGYVLDRRKKHSFGGRIQGYHDGQGAMINQYAHMDLSPKERLYRAGALMLGSAATRSVITHGGTSKHLVEIFPDRGKGIRIDVQERRAA